MGTGEGLSHGRSKLFGYPIGAGKIVRIGKEGCSGQESYRETQGESLRAVEIFGVPGNYRDHIGTDALERGSLTLWDFADPDEAAKTALDI